MDSVLAVRSPQIISEILDGEAVIIDLETGTYYSLDPIASSIWDAIAAGGSTASAIVEGIGAAYGKSAPEVESALTPFFARLAAERLVVSVPGSQAAPAPAPFPKVSTSLTEPTLSRFDDIQDLLLLDPIHEVEESGWPARKPDPGDEPA
jgi:hypothetical protein